MSEVDVERSETNFHIHEKELGRYKSQLLNNRREEKGHPERHQYYHNYEKQAF